MITDILFEINRTLNTLFPKRIFFDTVLPIIVAFGTLGAAIFAATAAIAANRSAKSSERAIKNSTIDKILSERYSEKTYSTRIQLRIHFNTFEDNRKAMMSAFMQERKVNPGFDMDKRRREFSDYFRKLFDLRLFSFLTDKEMSNYVNWSDLDMLFRIVVPLEVAVFNTIEGHPQVTLATFKNEVFDYFQIIYRYLWKWKQLEESKISPQEKNDRKKAIKNTLNKEFKEYWNNRKKNQIDSKYFI